MTNSDPISADGETVICSRRPECEIFGRGSQVRTWRKAELTLNRNLGRGQKLLIAAAASGLLLVPACALETAGGTAITTHEFRVDVADYTFHHVPTVPRGRVVLRAANHGSVDHSVVILSLPEDLPPLQDQLLGDERRAVALLGRILALVPGSEDSIALDLGPGRYGIVCNMRYDDGSPHSVKGMNSEFTVAES